jgi:ribosomal protein S12 methylthiotransferase accessory factor YcaO
MKQDKARSKTDKILQEIEGAISALYKNNPDLINAQKQYQRYMSQVDKLTEAVKKEYDTETDAVKKRKLKQDYIKQVEWYTTNNSQYKSLVENICRIMATVNQKALDIVNDRLEEIYMINYNQVAVECKRVGIEVIDG